MTAILSSLVPVLGWALIHFLWQGMLVGAVTAIALSLLRNARPQARYAVSCAALAACLLLPSLAVWRGLHAEGTIEVATAPSAVHYADISGPANVATLSSWQSTLQPQLPWIVALWSLGAALLALRMALGMMWVGRIGNSPSNGIDLNWQARLDRLARSFGETRNIRLRVSSNLDSPVAAGWWRPIVLVPAALIARMPPDLLEALLAHELAHIKRHDYLVNLIQSTIEALLFYHPVVWWLSRQIRVEREQIADDLAASALGTPRRLALALQELDRFQLEQPPYPLAQLAPAAHGGNLMSRIQRLIRPNQHALSWNMALPIIGLSAVCLSVYAHSIAPSAINATVAPAPTVAATPAIAATPAVAVSPVVAPAPTVGATPAAVAAPAVAPTPAVMVGSLSTFGTLHVNDVPRDAYAVVRAGQDGMTMSGSTEDIPAIERTKKNVHGDFVWVRRGKKTYVVQDPNLIAKVAEAWRPADAIDAQINALDARMEAPNRQMEALSQQMEVLETKGHPYDEAMEKTSAQMEALGQQQEAISAKMEALDRRIEQSKLAEREPLGAQMQSLQAQMESISKQMAQLDAEMEMHSKRMQAAQQPMEQLSRQMEQISQPLEPLNRQIEALSKQEEQLSAAADRTVNALIDDALQNGKAVPLDATAR
jgi:beta-lactamase regulating signal transducer with metallopeptidase domain/archaellum component FlaC